MTLAELKVYLSDELDKRFRKTAMDAYGYGRGSISKAAAEALSKWCAEHEASPTVRGEAEATSTNAVPPVETSEKTAFDPKETNVPTKSSSG